LREVSCCRCANGHGGNNGAAAPCGKRAYWLFKLRVLLVPITLAILFGAFLAYSFWLDERSHG
jgi:hypothetical protein